MSADTKAALDAAMAAHVADESDESDGAILTGYVCQTSFTSMSLLDEEMTGYQRLTMEGQNLTTTIGLMHYGQRMLDQHLITTLIGDE